MTGPAFPAGSGIRLDAPAPSTAGLRSPAVPGAASASSDSSAARAVALLDGLEARPLAEHPDVYQQVHEALQATLADIDDA